MKKIFVLLFGLLAAGQVFAQTAVCPGTIYSAGTNLFVVRDFPVRCSSNVTVTSRENAVAFAVGSVSSKGKSFFRGTTGGGAISGQACPGATCLPTDADTAGAVTLTQLLNAST